MVKSSIVSTMMAQKNTCKCWYYRIKACGNIIIDIVIYVSEAWENVQMVGKHSALKRD